MVPPGARKLCHANESSPWTPEMSEEVEVDDQVKRGQPIEPGSALVEQTLMSPVVRRPGNPRTRSARGSTTVTAAPDFPRRLAM